MTLTVTEKDHWKERISRKIDAAIEAIYAKADPGLLDRIRSAARDKALESLHLLDLERALDDISRKKKALDIKEKETFRKMLAIVRRCDLDEVDLGYSYRPHEVENAIGLRAAIHETELLAEHPLGRRILDLRTEKEELLDTVWLATSGKQIKDLWSKVAELLGQESTALQRQALEMDPVPDDLR
jgi:hypothetical protein